MYYIERNAAVPEYEVFRNHYGDLSNMLFSTNLGPQLVQRGVIVPQDEEEISTTPTSSGKAGIVLQKISRALETGYTESFYKMLKVMESFGNQDAWQLSSTIEKEIVSQRDKGLFHIHIIKIMHTKYVFT